jgi:hypothetical protein
MAHRYTLLLCLAAVGCAPAVGPQPFDIREGQFVPAEYSQPTTADGEVLGVDRQSPSRELAEGLTVRLRAGGADPVVVQLAPGWYLEQNGIGYGPSERVVVRGRRAQRAGSPVFVATEIQSGDRWIPLRDEQGRPLWPQQTPAR